MHFWTPKRLFHTKLMKKTLFYSKSLPDKSIARILKKQSGGKVRAPKKTEFHDFGPPKLFP